MIAARKRSSASSILLPKAKAASWAKLKANDEKYPVDKAKGSMKKYTEL